MTKQQIEAYIDAKTAVFMGSSTDTAMLYAYKYGLALSMVETCLLVAADYDGLTLLPAIEREARRMGVIQ